MAKLEDIIDRGKAKMPSLVHRHGHTTRNLPTSPNEMKWCPSPRIMAIAGSDEQDLKVN
jgi:hypothetical protein